MTFGPSAVPAAENAFRDCDVMLAVGARFDDRITGELAKFSPYAKIVHVDVDPASIGKNVKVDVPIVGDAKKVLEDFVKELKSRGHKPDQEQTRDWWQQIQKWRDVDSLGYDRDSDIIKPQYVVEKLHEVTSGDAFVTSDVGKHQMFAAQFYGFAKTRRWINSGGLGTMGFGLPSAMGVQLAYPDDLVCCITGEASIIMCIQELSTAKQYDLPVKVINFTNVK